MTGTLPEVTVKLRPMFLRTNDSRSDMILSKESFTNLKIHSEDVVLQSGQVKRTPQTSVNEFIIQKLSPLAVVDFGFISTFLHS